MVENRTLQAKTIAKTDGTLCFTAFSSRLFTHKKAAADFTDYTDGARQRLYCAPSL